MTKEEFENRYAEGSGITVEKYRELLETRVCNCGDETCDGWAAYSRGPEG